MAAEPLQDSRTTALMRVLSHPLRARILHELNAGEASPSELAGRLGEPLGNVAYHVQILARNDAVELVQTRQVRGAIEHFYRATSRPDVDGESWAKLPASVRGRLFDDRLEGVWSGVLAAAEDGGFESPEERISHLKLELDDQGREDLAERLDGFLEQLRELQSESAARLGELPDEKRESERTELALLHFRSVAADATG